MSSAVVQESSNRMKFFDKRGHLNQKTFFDFIENDLDIPKAQLANAFGFSSDQLRVERMSKKTTESFSQLAASIEQVSNILSNNKDKTIAWFNIPNAHFGGSSPKELILIGKFRKIQNFIFSSQYM